MVSNPGRLLEGCRAEGCRSGLQDCKLDVKPRLKFGKTQRVLPQPRTSKAMKQADT